MERLLGLIAEREGKDRQIAVLIEKSKGRKEREEDFCTQVLVKRFLLSAGQK